MLIPISKERLHHLAKLKQKKFRNSENLVIVEGGRVLEQLGSWGIKPLELYCLDNETPLPADSTYQISAAGMARICDSEHPPSIAGLFPLPQVQEVKFQTAFYLEDISDPGNLGTIFRSAAAFGISALILSPNCCEVGSPKVIRSSLGAVYKVPFWICDISDIPQLGASIYALDMNGTQQLESISKKAKPQIIALGSEAHGLSAELRNLALETLGIPITKDMESLNVAISFVITAYELFKTSGRQNE